MGAGSNKKRSEEAPPPNPQIVVQQEEALMVPPMVELEAVDPPLVDQGNVGVLQPHLTPSAHSELGVTVPEAIKAKIISGQYIELAGLVHSDSLAADVLGTVVVAGPSCDLIVKSQSSTKKVTTIETWTDAMLVFTSVYLSAHPERTQDILKYINTVRLGQKMHWGTGWRIYDEQFRHRMAANPAGK